APAADAPAVEAPATTEAETPPPAQPGRRPVGESQVEIATAPTDAPPSPDVPSGAGADTTPPPAPTVGAMPSALPDTSEPQGGAQVAVATDAPVLPGAQAQAPDAPAPDAEPAVTTQPAQPPQPALPAEEAPLVDETAEDKPEDAPDAPAAAAPALPTVDSAEELAPEPDAGAPRIGQPAGSLIDRQPAVPTGRLVSVGDDAEAEAEAPQAEAQPAADRPLDLFAAQLEIPADTPRMSIVLIDDGSGPLGPQALEAFPFPVSFAIDPGHPNAAKVARDYRALGFEVMALADVPEGAQPTDVEVALAGLLDTVPEAVAVLEAPGGGLQSSRAISDQAAAYLADSGHGLVMMPKGLNTAQQLAARAGVPSATLFRDFDAEGQNANVIRRTLDTAAFRARQEGAVILLGRLRADTISALVLWGLQDRGETLSLVPVSVVLREADQG
ncbi:MAG: divergent polysaccharide deacetylase family protein, partial [Paracoccaceae bacterium]|nr:divergent polysaccharide deacetylase family protein [Paracoccaceae bacterium]